MVQRRKSEPVVGREITADLGHFTSSENHKCGAGAVCTRRRACHDARAPRRANLRWNQALLSCPMVQRRTSEPVVGREITADLGHFTSSEHHKCGAGAVCTRRWACHDARAPRRDDVRLFEYIVYLPLSNSYTIYVIRCTAHSPPPIFVLVPN